MEEYQVRRRPSLEVDYVTAASRDEAKAETKMFEEGWKLLKAEQAKCGGEKPRRLVANRAIQDLRVKRVVRKLGALFSLLEEGAHELPYLSRASASEIVMGTALVLGDERVVAWLFLGEDVNFGDEVFDPLRQRLTLRPGSCFATLPPCAVWEIRRVAHSLAFEDPLLENITRADCSKAPNDSGWQALGCLCWLAQRDDDGWAARHIQNLPDAAAVEAILALAHDLGLGAVRCSWLSEDEPDWTQLLTKKKMVLTWRPGNNNNNNNSNANNNHNHHHKTFHQTPNNDVVNCSGCLDVILGNFDVHKGFRLPLTDVTASRGRASFRRDWDAVVPLSSARRKPHETKSLHFAAAVECAALGDIVEERLGALDRDEALGIEHCEALSGSLFMVAELGVVKRMRAVDAERLPSTLDELQTALQTSLERALRESAVVPLGCDAALDRWCRSYAQIIWATHRVIPQTAVGHYLPSDLVSDVSASIDSINRLYNGCCDVSSKQRVQAHLTAEYARRAQAARLLLSRLDLAPRWFRALLVLACVACYAATHLALGLLVPTTLISISDAPTHRHRRRVPLLPRLRRRALSFLGLVAWHVVLFGIVLSALRAFLRRLIDETVPRAVETTLYARLRRCTTTSLLVERIAALRAECTAVYANWQRHVAVAQLADCINRGRASLAEATAALDSCFPSVPDTLDDFLALRLEPRAPKNQNAVLPLAYRLIDAVDDILASPLKCRAYYAEKRAAALCESFAFEGNEDRTVEDALVEEGWRFDREAAGNVVVGYRKPPGRSSPVFAEEIRVAPKVIDDCDIDDFSPGISREDNITSSASSGKKARTTSCELPLDHNSTQWCQDVPRLRPVAVANRRKKLRQRKK